MDAGQAAIDAIMDTGGQSWVAGTVCETFCKIVFKVIINCYQTYQIMQDWVYLDKYVRLFVF